MISPTHLCLRTHQSFTPPSQRKTHTHKNTHTVVRLRSRLTNTHTHCCEDEDHGIQITTHTHTYTHTHTAVRLRATPPALRLIKNTRTVGSLVKACVLSMCMCVHVCVCVCVCVCKRVINHIFLLTAQINRSHRRRRSGTFRKPLASLTKTGRKKKAAHTDWRSTTYFDVHISRTPPAHSSLWVSVQSCAKTSNF